VAQGRQDEALELLAEAFPMRAELRSAAGSDPELAPLRADQRFRSLING
jgi:hypothetical protein